MKNQKFYFIFLFLICLTVMGMADSKKASAKTGSGPCGSNASWKYDTETEKLEIFGTGVVKKVIHVKKRMHLKRKGLYVKELVVHEGITGLSNGIFKNVLYLRGTEVSLPDSFRKISSEMFTNLGPESLFIPKNVSVIEEPAFWGQSFLKEITVSPLNQHYCSIDGVLYTKDMSKLVYYPQEKKDEFFRVPDSVVRIAPLAFRGNYCLKKVRLPHNLEELGGGAFYYCRALKSINISRLHKLKRIRDYCGIFPFTPIFYGEEREEEMNYNGFSSNGSDSTQKFDHYGTFAYTSIRSFTMPDSLQYMASETFRCSSVRRFTVGKNFIGGINSGKEFTQKSVNLYYVKLHKLTVSAGNKAYQMDGNILYTMDGKTLCYVVSDKKYQKETLVIPKQVKEIAHGAFRFVSLYKNIVVEGDLNKIGVSAFAGSKISSFHVKGTIHKLMMGAFMNSRIKSFKYEGGLTSIPANAFIDAYLLERFDLYSKVTDIGNKAFSGCDNLKEVSGIDAIKRLGDFVFDDCDSLKNLVLPNLESAGWGAFPYIEKIIVPESAVIVDRKNDKMFGRLVFIPSQKTIEQYKKAFSLYMLAIVYTPLMI